MSKQPEKLMVNEFDFIAYHKTQGKTNHPTVLFLGGFMSDMNGTKATALESFCIKNDYSFIRFDYFGHGQSSHNFTDGTIGIWLDNTLNVIDQLTEGPLIIIGSSMGGWLMLLATLQRKQRVKAIIGIASAPDFTEDLIANELDPEALDTLEKEGVFLLKSDYGDDPYPITKDLIEDGKNHLLLRAPININVPVRLIHGKKDCDVPHSLSTKIAELLTSNDVKVTIVEEADHRMSEPQNIDLLTDQLKDLIEQLT